MLMLCDLCGQVVEVATLHAHQLDECENAHQDVAKRKELKEKAANRICPLSGVKVPVIGGGGDDDVDEGWRQHLKTCPKNPRCRPCA